MKKKYEKPMVLFEDFSMSTNIANGCDFTEVTATENQYGCGIEHEYQDPFTGQIITGTIFISGICTSPYQDDEEYNGFCYHNPSDTNNLFNS